MHVNPISEAAKRKVLIAPILLEICAQTQTQLNIEYPINVSEQLKVTFDYYISSDNSLLVIKAKQSDLSRGLLNLQLS